MYKMLNSSLNNIATGRLQGPQVEMPNLYLAPPTIFVYKAKCDSNYSITPSVFINIAVSLSVNPFTNSLNYVQGKNKRSTSQKSTP